MTNRLAVVGLCLLSACATACVYPALTLRLYDVAGATTLTATATNDGSGHGRIEILLPSGERLVGEYTTLAGGVAGWGRIYALAGDGAQAASLHQFAVAADEQQGSLAAVGDRGTAIECEYLVNLRNHGRGACKDNKGTTYKLLY